MNTKEKNNESSWPGILLGVLFFFIGAWSIWDGPPYVGKGGLPMPEATAWIAMLFGLLMTFAPIRRLLRERRKSRSRQAAPDNGEPPDTPE